MTLNLRLYVRTIYYAFFKSKGTPGRLTPKRFLILTFIFLFYPLWRFSIRIAYLLDNIFYPDYHRQEVKQPIFIVGNFRSGTTFLHRLLTKDSNATSMTSWEIYVAPSIVGRKFLHWGMRLNYAIGNPVRRVIDTFDHMMARVRTSAGMSPGFNWPSSEWIMTPSQTSIATLARYSCERCIGLRV